MKMGRDDYRFVVLGVAAAFEAIEVNQGAVGLGMDIAVANGGSQVNQSARRTAA